MILIDHGTGQLAFTECDFKDCNIDSLGSQDDRGLFVRNNTFHRALEEPRFDFESRLEQALASQKAKQK